MAKKAQLDEVRPVLDATNNVIDKVEKALDGLDQAVDTGAKVVEHGLEKVADVVPEALDTSVHVSTKGGRHILEALRRPKVQAFTVIGLSMTIGAGLGVAGYFLLKKKLRADLEVEFDDRLEEEVRKLQKLYARRNKEGAYSTPEAAVEALIPEGPAKEALKNYQGTLRVVDEPAETEVVEESAPERKDGPTREQIAELAERMKNRPVQVEETTTNLFVDGNPIKSDFDYEAELRTRDTELPYLITFEEFNENPNGHSQITITYYNGDDILADDKDLPVEDVDAVVGSENLARFGEGSHDRNIVYVRNERIETDFEIVFSSGEFAVEVAGTKELRHSMPLRRFRESDDA